MDLVFQWNSNDLRIFQNKAMAKAVAKALKRAGNRAITTMRAEAKRQIRARSTVKAQYLASSSLPLDYPKASASDALVWRMRVSGKGVPLGQFKARQTKTGVTVEVLKGVAKKIRSAFLAASPRSESSRPGVFLRPPGSERYPMGHRLGPRVSDILNNPELLAAVGAATMKSMRGEFARLLALELRK